MLALGTGPPGLTLARARSALLTTLSAASAVALPTPLRCAAWQAYTSTASWHQDPHASGSDPSATVVHSYPSPGDIAEHMAVAHNADAPRRLEIARRLLRHAHAAALAETLGLAKKLGLRREDVWKCLAEGPGTSWVEETMGEAMVRLRGEMGEKTAGEKAEEERARGRPGAPSPAKAAGGGEAGRRTDKCTIAEALAELSGVLDVANSIPLATPVAGAAQQVFVLAAALGLGPEDEVA